MFYSQLLLSKKGALGIVWLAAHCYRRLKKDQIYQTNISSSVDKILYDEVPVVTHRILAFLLLGVVRIYSKKVEYLFEDCHEVLNKLYGLNTAKKAKRSGIGGVSGTRYYSISVPKRFALDTFDLELREDQGLVGGNVISHEQNVPADARKKTGGTSGFLLKEKMPFAEAYTPPRDVFISHDIDRGGSSSNMNISLTGLEVLRGSRFCLEDRVDPIELDEAEDAQLHDKVFNEDMTTNLQEPTNLAPSLEKLRRTTFTLEDRLDPMILDEVEKEQMNNDGPSSDKTSSKFREPIQETELVSAANQSPQGSDLVPSLGVLHKIGSPFQHSPSFKMLDEAEKGQGQHELEEEHREHLKAQPMGSKKLRVSKVVTAESLRYPLRNRNPLSVVVTPDSKISEVATVRTPATRERARILKNKRKILFDSVTMVSNKEYKTWINNPSDLKRRRRDVPHTVLHARKFGHFEPFIPVISTDLGDHECEKMNIAAIKPVELPHGRDGKSPVVESLSVGQGDVVKSPFPQVEREKIGDAISPRSPVAPGTPVTRSKSMRMHEAGAVAADSDIILEPPTSSSSESVDKSPESDFVFLEEAISFEGHSRGKSTFSARTRMMGSYLSEKFLERKKQKVEQVLNVSHLLAGKTKKESARMFYEILVLKTQGCIDVEQENAYDDILVRETRKLKQMTSK